jgi:AmmeMemoRadiSam system protein B
VDGNLLVSMLTVKYCSFARFKKEIIDFIDIFLYLFNRVYFKSLQHLIYIFIIKMASNITLKQIITRTPLCYYYSSEKSQCLQEIISSYLHRLGPGQLPSEFSTSNNDDTSFIPCMLVPHGAYCDSGPLYAQAYYWINSFVFDTVLIIGTNHCGAGSSNISLSSDSWQTPLDLVEIDTDLFNTFVSVLGVQTIDREAHRKEHSIENQLPFLKHLRPKVKFVALSFSRLNDLTKGYQVCEQIKKAIHLYRQQTGI